MRIYNFGVLYILTIKSLVLAKCESDFFLQRFPGKFNSMYIVWLQFAKEV